MKKLRLSVALGLLLIALAAPVAYAEHGDDDEQGHKAPEVPIALLLPAAAVAAVSVRAALGRKR